MALTLVLSGIFVSLSCFLKATLGEEIAGGLCDVNDSFMGITLFKFILVYMDVFPRMLTLNVLRCFSSCAHGRCGIIMHGRTK